MNTSPFGNLFLFFIDVLSDLVIHNTKRGAKCRHDMMPLRLKCRGNPRSLMNQIELEKRLCRSSPDYYPGFFMANIAEVVIIGAGVAGLKAAHTLLKFGLPCADLKVLEAQDHVGGRIHTATNLSKLGYKYDLGALWFHDSLTNVVLEELAQDPEFVFSRDAYYDDKVEKMYTSQGQLDVAGLKLDQVVEDLEKFKELYFFDNLEVQDISLPKITTLFLEKFGYRLSQQQILHAQRALRYLELWFGCSWDEISSKYSMMDHQGRNLFNKKGYGYLIEKLTRDIPANCVATNSPVCSINRRNTLHDRKIAVETSTGNTIYCNYLVVTVPLSILQLPMSSPQSIHWNPPIPPPITSALEKVHFGALGKVIFEFNSIWWPKDEDRFTVWHDEIPGFVPSKPLTSLPPSYAYPTHVVNFATIHSDDLKRGSSLLILTQAPLTQYLETHKDEAWSYYKPMLSHLEAPGHKIQDPINVITTEWTKNPYIRGSYTTLHTNDDPTDILINLSGEHEGIGLSDTNIRFAGEHTTIDGAACVHGAYASGEREAEWILKNLKL